MIIYKATNKVNGKSYIGQTDKGLLLRQSQHCRESRYKRYNSYFHKAIQKYGENNFIWEVICTCNSKEELDKMEIYYIKLYGDYNLTDGGYSLRGTTWEDIRGKEKADRDKVSQSNLMTEKNPMYNPEVVERMKESRRNSEYWKSEDHKAAIEKQRKKMSKEWTIITPDGEEIVISNLNEFCRDNNLSPGTMVEVANGNRRQHKGFKCNRR